MTDFTDDELVSAVLDGEATDEEAARVRADATLSARLDELRAARDVIAASAVALPTNEQRDALIAVAMGSAGAPADAPAAVSPAIDMHDRRRRRALRIASIAAALLAVAGLVGAIAAISGRNSPKSSGTAAGQAPSTSEAVSAATQPGEAAAASTDSTAAAAGGRAELGSFQTRQDLVNAVKTQMRPALREPQPPGAALPDTGAAVANCGPRNNVTYMAFASLAGQPVIVIVSGSTGQQTIEVVDLSCTVVFTQPLD